MSKLVVGLLLRGIRRNVVDLCLCMSLDASQPPSRRPLVESRSKQSCLSSSGNLKKKKVGCCFVRLERNAQMWLSKTRRSWIADFFFFFFLSDADVDRFASNKFGVRTETQLGEYRDLPRSLINYYVDGDVAIQNIKTDNNNNREKTRHKLPIKSRMSCYRWR